MNPGDLRDRIFIEQRASTRDAVGGIVETWSTFANVWAKVAPMSSGEQYRRHQMQASANWKIIVRYRTGITPQMRVTFGARRFEIRGVTNPDMKKMFLELACEEIAIEDQSAA